MFEYLKQYIDDKRGSRNGFWQLELTEIIEEESRLGYQFPPQLRRFYQEIGYGCFRNNHDLSVNTTSYANRLLDPNSVADIKLLGYDSGQIVPSVEFAHDEIPIFEVADGDMFFVMKPHSDKPNAVYHDMNGELIEESFEKFIWRLYYESPLYYMKDWDNED